MKFLLLIALWISPQQSSSFAIPAPSGTLRYRCVPSSGLCSLTASVDSLTIRDQTRRVKMIVVFSGTKEKTISAITLQLELFQRARTSGGQASIYLTKDTDAETERVVPVGIEPMDAETQCLETRLTRDEFLAICTAKTSALINLDGITSRISGKDLETLRLLLKTLQAE